MEIAVLIFLALVVGAFMPTQAGINALLRTHVLSPYTAALVSFFIGTLALLLWCLVVRVPLPGAKVFHETPWWQWFGGTLGAVIVAGSIILAPRLGATSMLALMVTGQMAASLLLDHYGVLGYPVHEASLLRILGCLLVIVGVVLVQKF